MEDSEKPKFRNMIVCPYWLEAKMVGLLRDPADIKTLFGFDLRPDPYCEDDVMYIFDQDGKMSVVQLAKQ